MQLGKVHHYYFVYLQVSLFALAFGVHHAHEVAIPVGQLLLVVLVVVELANVFASQASHAAVVSPYDVFYLPHVEQVFGNAFLAKLL